jgi:nitrate reductase assembly molybdenum cofactor insertion protein NarJ
MARLTEEQRQVLVNLALNNIENMNKISYTEFLNFLVNNSNIANLNLANVTPILERMDKAIKVKKLPYAIECKKNYDGCTLIYFQRADHIYTNDRTFTKERNILHLNCCEGLTYDFVTKKFSFNLDNMYRAPYRFQLYLEQAFEFEWLFNYTTDLDTIFSIVSYFDKEEIQTMPKGFYEVVKDTPLSVSLLREFIGKQRYGKYYKFAIDGLGENKAYSFTKAGGRLDTLVKIIKNSIENGFLYIGDEVDDFISLFVEVKAISPNIQLDDNRDLDHNTEYLNDIRDKEKNDALAKRLQKLNFINNLTKNNLVVVVPQNQAEKRAEGKMQNNCVGHYYDNSILRGENFIYFIRKVDKKDKSYITCRYNKERKETAEYRIVNNGTVTDRNALAFIAEIDEIIRKNLK